VVYCTPMGEGELRVPYEWDSKLGEQFKVYRDYLEHEDELLHQRSTWNLYLHGFLFAAYGVLLQQSAKGGENPRATMLFLLLPSVGFIIALCVLLSVIAAMKSIDRLAAKWKDEVISGYPPLKAGFFPALTGAGDSFASKYGKLPARWIPIVIAFAWMVLLVANVQESKAPKQPITPRVESPSSSAENAERQKAEDLSRAILRFNAGRHEMLQAQEELVEKFGIKVMAPESGNIRSTKDDLEGQAPKNTGKADGRPK
jgi:hypothetical protein